MFDRKVWYEKYYAGNREKLRAKRKEYYWEHKEQSSEYAKEYNKKNRAKIRIRQRKWRVLNPDKAKEMSDKQREKNRVSGALKFHKMRELAKRRGITCTWDKWEFMLWFKSQSGRCHYCGTELMAGLVDRLKNFTLDRLDNDKGYEPGNIVACCGRCNMMKGSWLTAEQTLEIATRYFKSEAGRN